ncbi:MAG: hypothetical protein QOD56_2167 [Gammaproteobacteria bacterium]|nr:hypothetical protein [Gammaproteobacteria bacterium]
MWVLLDLLHKHGTQNPLAVGIQGRGPGASFGYLPRIYPEDLDMSTVPMMDGNQPSGVIKSTVSDPSAAVSDEVLRSIAEEGFFASTGSLAEARAACAELIFARAIIQAQTAQIMQLGLAPAK